MHTFAAKRAVYTVTGSSNLSVGQAQTQKRTFTFMVLHLQVFYYNTQFHISGEVCGVGYMDINATSELKTTGHFSISH